jgi:hypothetical protein
MAHWAGQSHFRVQIWGKEYLLVTTWDIPLIKFDRHGLFKAQDTHLPVATDFLLS